MGDVKFYLRFFSSSFQLLITDGPENVYLNASMNKTLNENDGIAIRCFANCYPICTYLWESENFQLVREILVLDPVKRGDAGQYTCVVTNSANSSWTATSPTVTIHVRCK